MTNTSWAHHADECWYHCHYQYHYQYHCIDQYQLTEHTPLKSQCSCLGESVNGKGHAAIYIEFTLQEKQLSYAYKSRTHFWVSEEQKEKQEFYTPETSVIVHSYIVIVSSDHTWSLLINIMITQVYNDIQYNTNYRSEKGHNSVGHILQNVVGVATLVLTEAKVWFTVLLLVFRTIIFIFHCIYDLRSLEKNEIEWIGEVATTNVYYSTEY